MRQKKNGDGDKLTVLPGFKGKILADEGERVIVRRPEGSITISEGRKISSEMQVGIVKSTGRDILLADEVLEGGAASKTIPFVLSGLATILGAAAIIGSMGIIGIPIIILGTAYLLKIAFRLKKLREEKEALIAQGLRQQLEYLYDRILDGTIEDNWAQYQISDIGYWKELLVKYKFPEKAVELLESGKVNHRNLERKLLRQIDDPTVILQLVQEGKLKFTVEEAVARIAASFGAETAQALLEGKGD
ncbi:hypothetical protein HY988_04055 [Candidatus Micrarchaeota archaeon]|nr:hypothetical protein [Candidatus Micrarchaeota archaeon]